MGHDDVHDLRRRLRDTRWPRAWPPTGGEADTDNDTMHSLVTYWADEFDGATEQDRINALPWQQDTVQR
ncbi:epoxide hydrolase N-terminal domain-containing protein [Cryobacterium sp. PH31-O1]|nr:epoxide hydrolase N-terminal domain-containing protein [Cryobacterium sp. PH31-O1]MDJ0336678.1 epoxide hydrolase N-terminal domain-containing protein [Cryobacterium sp. PH31-O1]